MIVETNLLGELQMYRDMKIKPNFSSLERKYNVNRHTIKKYYVNGGIVRKTRKDKTSKYEKYKDEITQIMKEDSVTIMALYQYLAKKYEKDRINYNGLKHYTLKLGIKRKGIKEIPHIRYETLPGEQLQVDWKEDIEMISSLGEVFKFNVFGATLGYSREHVFIYSKTRTTEDFLRCMIDTFNRIGGLPQTIKTDNMSAVVSIKNGTKKKHPKILQFERDTGVKIKLCRPYTPQTKGKVESANRFLNWLKPYNHKFKSEAELIEILNKITSQANNEVNQSTNLPPITLFKKEKEYLSPIPNRILLDNYVSTVETKTVPPTLLVPYKGNGYSVPKSYIGKRVKLLEIANKLYIYFNTELITIHELTKNKINYDVNHYTEALKHRLNDNNKNIDDMALNNLKLLSKIGDVSHE